MLVLTRKINEALLMMEGEVRIVVLSVQGDQVKLGIEAPRSISVAREEIYEATRENQRAAESVSPDALSLMTKTEKDAPSPRPTPKSR